MNFKQKSKSKTNVTKPYINKQKKVRKKSPKIIDYNKVAQKYGNLLETSLNTSNSTQPQKALNSNNIDDSYYDYIIDNIYETNNLESEKAQKIENSKNNDSNYYFTFKQNKNKSINNNSNNTSDININNKKYKNRPISIMSNKEEMNKYFNDKNNSNNNVNNNISSIKNYKKMSNTYNKQIKQTKTLKTNLSYKNDTNTEKYKKIEKVINTNYKSNKSYNNIKVRQNRNEIKDIKYIKEKPKLKRLSRINSQENNFSKKFNINSNIENINQYVRNSESIQVHGNESIKEEVINKDKKINKNENIVNNINNKLKEKVMLLLNLCRKYAYKFNKLFPICESTTPNNSKNQSLLELKNTIIQYNNMIFNQNISKIFDLDDNQKDFLNILDDNETKKLNNNINELSEQINILKKNEIYYQNNINDLNKKIEILNNELLIKDNIINDLKNKINMKTSGKIKEFHGLVENNNNINRNIKLNENYTTKKIDKIDKNINFNSYNKISNKNNNYNIEKFHIEEVKTNINNKLNFDSNKNQPKNTEIEKLDQEIFNLKSKLKKIIQK